MNQGRIQSIKVSVTFDLNASMYEPVSIDQTIELTVDIYGFKEEILYVKDLYRKVSMVKSEYLNDEEYQFLQNWLESNADEIKNSIVNHVNNNGYLDELVCEYDIDPIDVNSLDDNQINVKTEKPYTQVCIWPGCILNEHEVDRFEATMLENFGARVKYLESIETGPDMINDNPVPETGGRHDLFFAVHEDDIGSFAVKRLAVGIRWIEDVLSPMNYRSPIYPKRVFGYKTW